MRIVWCVVLAAPLLEFWANEGEKKRAGETTKDKLLCKNIQGQAHKPEIKSLHCPSELRGSLLLVFVAQVLCFKCDVLPRHRQWLLRP
ncbi:hypothetical protein B0T16DRAFT_415183 [Cercophora newfieldiana]|uniref:Secreted protein n=1 Tax=Cercophora newfieldiana TaxID=92897 RepID=A0AA39Y1A3_9PEZI|nr:hypothetical protein B0T16DRAFT_415183 [Cercophora newfieldiana]